MRPPFSPRSAAPRFAAPCLAAKGCGHLPLRAPAVASLLLTCATLGAQTTTVVMPPAPLLPGHIGAWSAEPATDQTGPASPALLLDADNAAAFKEDGLLRSAQARYKSGSGPAAQVQALQFHDATGAVAAYTFLRESSMRETAVAPGTRNSLNVAVSGTRTLLRDGVSLAVIDAPAGSLSSSDLRALEDGLPKVGGPRGLPPLLPTYLPAEGLLPGMVEYAVGPVSYGKRGGVLPPELIGFGKAGEAATASYAGRAGSGTLTLLLLPTPELAGERGRAIEAWLNTPAGRTAAAGTAKLRRVGPMLALATGTWSPEQAETIVNGIHLRTEVTWNKPVPPEFHMEVRKTASLLSSIIIFSGVAGLAAILLGLFLGFGRASIRVLMGKPAATEPEFLRLDLRSSASAEK